MSPLTWDQHGTISVLITMEKLTFSCEEQDTYVFEKLGKRT